MVDLHSFIVKQSCSIRDALDKIQANRYGIIFVVSDDSNSVVGLATDGDIRRSLLNNISIENSISLCINKNFISVAPNYSREDLLKKLDNRIRIIPVLNAAGELLSIFTRDNIPALKEQRLYARSTSPVRISFGGGGSDLTNYFSSQSGAVINATISLYSHATLKLREDDNVRIFSEDLKQSISADNLSLLLNKKSDFGLIQSILKIINPTFGFDLYIHSDFPLRSGLGGSAVVSSAILGCFNEFRQDRWDSHELAEIAFEAERLHLNVAGGWQDQYATVFGGFNFIEFNMSQNIVHPLRINTNVLLELEESLILCDTGLSHDSGKIHSEQKINMKNEIIQNEIKYNVDLSYQMKNYLLRGKLLDFGKLLNQAWQSKRKFSDKISNNSLDCIYNLAISNGAIGGKLLGAGGGGFFLFYVTPFRKLNLMEGLTNAGLKLTKFKFDLVGLQSWTARENFDSEIC